MSIYQLPKPKRVPLAVQTAIGGAVAGVGLLLPHAFCIATAINIFAAAGAAPAMSRQLGLAAPTVIGLAALGVFLVTTRHRKLCCHMGARIASVGAVAVMAISAATAFNAVTKRSYEPWVYGAAQAMGVPAEKVLEDFGVICGVNSPSAPKAGR